MRDFVSWGRLSQPAGECRIEDGPPKQASPALGVLDLLSHFVNTGLDLQHLLNDPVLILWRGNAQQDARDY